MSRFFLIVAEAIFGFYIFACVFRDGILSYLMPIFGAFISVVVGTMVVGVTETVGNFAGNVIDAATNENGDNSIEVSFDVTFGDDSNKALPLQSQLMTVKCPYCGTEWMITENTIMVKCSSCNNDFQVDWS